MSFAQLNALRNTGRARELAQHYEITRGDLATMKELIAVNGEHGCYPSQEMLAAWTGGSRKAIYDSLKRLEKAGAITMEERIVGKMDRYGRRWKGKRTYYHFDEWLDIFLDRVVAEDQETPLQMSLFDDPAEESVDAETAVPARSWEGGSHEVKDPKVKDPKKIVEPSFQRARATDSESRKGGWKERVAWLEKAKGDPEELPDGYGVRDESEKRLTEAMLRDPDIGMNREGARAIAEVIRPQEVFEHAVQYQEDRARGKVHSPAVLMHRLTHQRRFPAQPARYGSDFYERYYERIPGYGV